MSKSLNYLTSNCTGFIEESLLQSMGHQMGTIIDRIPKCHPELPSKCIEFSLACSKNKYWLLPLGDWRSQDQSKEHMKTCLSNNILTKELIRKNSRRAHEYMCLHHFFNQQQQTAQAFDLQQQNITAPTTIESLVKKNITHCCALDFDHGFQGHHQRRRGQMDDNIAS